MDRSLDEIINSRDAPRGRGRRGGRGDNYSRGPRRDERAAPPRHDDFPRDGVRKSYRDNGRDNIDRDWVHDKFEDDDSGRPARGSRNGPHAGYSPSPTRQPSSRTIRADSLHYDLTENDLHSLFSRIGPVQSIRLLYDRADRSQGIAFITYEHPDDARDAMREFDGANAMGQPIRLTLQQGQGSKPSRNPFDHADKPSRSLFDRIEGGDRSRRGRRGRSASPQRASENIDRYVPGNRGRHSRSPQRRGAGREPGRAPGARREERGRRGGRGNRGGEGRPVAQGRPRKTAEELDAEMDNYFNSNTGGGDAGGQVAQGSEHDTGAREAQVATAPQTENNMTGATSTMDDIDLMIE